MARNIIRIKYGDNNAVLGINGAAMTIDVNAASLIDTAIRTYVREWLVPDEENDNTFVSPTNDMKIVIKNEKDEVVFEVEEP